MTRLFTILPVLLILLLGCVFPYQETIRGNGVIVTEERDVGHFTSLRITGAHSTIVYGDREGPIRITTDENLLEYNESYVENGRLVITTTKNVNLRPTQRIEIEIPGKHIENVRVSGSNRIELYDIDQDWFRIRGSGSTRVAAAGYVGELEVRMSGSSRLDAGDLIADIATVRTSGSSRAAVHVEERIEARTSGSSRVSYSGNPEVMEVRSSGSSRVRAEQSAISDKTGIKPIFFPSVQYARYTSRWNSHPHPSSSASNVAVIAFFVFGSTGGRDSSISSSFFSDRISSISCLISAFFPGVRGIPSGGR